MDVVSVLASTPALFIGVSLVLGLLVGSFLNVIIHRMPQRLEADWRAQCRDLLDIPDANGEPAQSTSLWWPPSTCPSCGHRIRAWENIPVLSYLLLRGRCSACGNAISLRYPLVEGLSGLLTAAVAWHFGFGWEAGAGFLLTWVLIALSVIDLDHQILPDDLTLPLLWLGLLGSLAGLYADMQSAIIGAAAGYLSLWSVFQLFRLLTGKEGMGFGDFKLLAMLGAWMGWQALPVIIILSSLVGAVVGVALILTRGHDRNIPIPFGPYLAAAGWVALLYRHDLTDAYLRWAGLA
ncbi:prepilin peptidase [Ectothiorhodospiraceae bacterium WFHF3C12]|nr:prepilin peptidase [Ectothiorhodospiraceae bacterium WFHF3C12]